MNAPATFSAEVVEAMVAAALEKAKRTSASATPASQPAAVATATTPANPSRVSRFANWWDNSHVWQDISGWTKAKWPFGKPPSPPAPPSGGGGSGGGEADDLRRQANRLVGVIILATLLMLTGWGINAWLESMKYSEAGRQQVTTDAQAIALRARAVNLTEILKLCGDLAEKYQGQALPTECTGGISTAASPPAPKFNLGGSGSCANIGTARRGTQMVPIYGSGNSCSSSLSGSMSFFKGDFKVTSGSAYVIMKDCITWDDVENERQVSQGAKLSGCFRSRSDTTLKLTSIN